MRVDASRVQRVVDPNHWVVRWLLLEQLLVSVDDAVVDVERALAAGEDDHMAANDENAVHLADDSYPRSSSDHATSHVCWL